MSDSNIEISLSLGGIHRIAIPIVALVFIKACKDVACQWLENMRSKANTGENSCNHCNHICNHNCNHNCKCDNTSNQTQAPAQPNNIAAKTTVIENYSSKK